MTDQPTPRLRERFNQQIRTRLQQELGFANPNQVPRLEGRVNRGCDAEGWP